MAMIIIVDRIVTIFISLKLNLSFPTLTLLWSSDLKSFQSTDSRNYLGRLQDA